MYAVYKRDFFIDVWTSKISFKKSPIKNKLYHKINFLLKEHFIHNLCKIYILSVNFANHGISNVNFLDFLEQSFKRRFIGNINAAFVWTLLYKFIFFQQYYSLYLMIKCFDKIRWIFCIPNYWFYYFSLHFIYLLLSQPLLTILYIY